MVAELVLSMTPKTCHVDTAKFKAILDKVGSRPFVLYSINGCKRTGKSYTLSHFVRFFEWKMKKGDGEKKEEDWLDCKLPEEFEWRRGSERCTVGIYIWSEPFIVREDNDPENGREIAILLMDTQGLFDAETTTQQNAIIFSFSSFCSSVMIYNQMKFIDENILQNLHMFADFASVVAPEGMDDQDTCQQLIFLIRDFDYADEFGYGLNQRSKTMAAFSSELELQLESEVVAAAAAGDGRKKNYLHATLLLKGQTVTPEGLKARKKILQTFQEVFTFQMPDPGPGFRSNAEPVKPLAEFSQYLQQFVKMLTGPPHLTLKKIGGEEISGLNFYPYVEAWSTQYKNIEDSFPTVKTIAESMADVHNTNVAKKWLTFYKRKLDEFMFANPTAKEILFFKNHEIWRDETLGKFRTEKKLGSKEIHEKYLNELKRWIEEYYERKLAVHMALRAKAKKIKKRGKIATVGGAAAVGGASGVISYSVLEGTLGLIGSFGVATGVALATGGVAVGVGVVATVFAVRAAVKDSKTKTGPMLPQSEEADKSSNGPNKLLPFLLKKMS